KTLWTQNDLTSLAGRVEADRAREAGSKIPGTDHVPTLNDRDVGSRFVAFVLLIGALHFDCVGHRPELQMWIVCGRQLRRINQRRVRVKIIDENLKRIRGKCDSVSFVELGIRDGNNAIGVIALVSMIASSSW